MIQSAGYQPRAPPLPCDTQAQEQFACTGANLSRLSPRMGALDIERHRRSCDTMRAAAACEQRSLPALQDTGYSPGTLPPAGGSGRSTGVAGVLLAGAGANSRPSEAPCPCTRMRGGQAKNPAQTQAHQDAPGKALALKRTQNADASSSCTGRRVTEDDALLESATVPTASRTGVSTRSQTPTSGSCGSPNTQSPQNC